MSRVTAFSGSKSDVFLRVTAAIGVVTICYYVGKVLCAQFFNSKKDEEQSEESNPTSEVRVSIGTEQALEVPKQQRRSMDRESNGQTASRPTTESIATNPIPSHVPPTNSSEEPGVEQEYYYDALEQETYETEETKEAMDNPSNVTTSASCRQLHFWLANGRSRTNWTRHIMDFNANTKQEEMRASVRKQFGLSPSRSFCLYNPVDGRLVSRSCQTANLTLVESEIKDQTVFIILDEKEAKMSGRVGLVNGGNRCYMNASLQCLLHTPELMQYFLTQTFLEEINPYNEDGTNGKFADKFYKLLLMIWTGNEKSTNPKSFWREVGRYNDLFDDFDQHDAGELLETVLDALMEDCNQASYPKPYMSTFPSDPKDMDLDLAERYWLYHKSRSDAFVTDLFHGQYQVLTLCPRCEYRHRSYNTFSILHLGLPSPTLQLTFTLVVVWGAEPPMKCTIDLKRGRPIHDIYLAAAKLFEGKMPEFCFVQLSPNPTFFNAEDRIDQIKDRFDSTLFAYVSGEYGPSSGGIRTYLCNNFKVTSPSYGGPRNKKRSSEPSFRFITCHIVLWLPEQAISKLTDEDNDTIGTIMAPLLHCVKRGGKPGQDDESISSYQSTPLREDIEISKHKRTARPSEVRKQETGDVATAKYEVIWEVVVDEHYDLRRLELTRRDPARPLSPTHLDKELSGDLSIKDCLVHDFSPQNCAPDTDNLWRCKQCSILVDATKKLTLVKTPDVLFIGLKRFRFDEQQRRMVKINSSVQFPLTGLDLSKYCIEDPQAPDQVYDLYGVCRHDGRTSESGHYTSCVKTTDGTWYLFNDSLVTRISENNVVTDNAYVLCYRRRNAKSPQQRVKEVHDAAVRRKEAVKLSNPVGNPATEASQQPIEDDVFHDAQPSLVQPDSNEEDKFNDTETFMMHGEPEQVNVIIEHPASASTQDNTYPITSEGDVQPHVMTNINDGESQEMQLDEESVNVADVDQRDTTDQTENTTSVTGKRGRSPE